MSRLGTRLTVRLRDYWSALFLPLMAVVLGLLVGALAMVWNGLQEGLPFGEALYKPVLGYSALFSSVFGSLRNFGNATVYAVPLILTGLSVAFAFRCGLFNIGAEGQYIVGLFAAAYVGFTFNNWPWFLQLAAAFVAGGLAGGLWAAIAGVLKAKRGVHEVIVTIMLNHIAFHIYNFLVSDPEWFKIPNHQGSAPINPDIKLARLNELFGQNTFGRAHIGLLIALVVAGIIFWLLWKTTLGYEVRSVGLNAEAARYAGINVSRNFVLAMVISGVLAGLGGTLHLLGTMTRAHQFSMSPGYGFDGIAVALIGRNHPAGVVLSALLFAVLKTGSGSMQLQAGIAKEVISLVQAAIIFFVAADQIVKWIISRRNKADKGGVAVVD